MFTAASPPDVCSYFSQEIRRRATDTEQKVGTERYRTSTPFFIMWSSGASALRASGVGGRVLTGFRRQHHPLSVSAPSAFDGAASRWSARSAAAGAAFLQQRTFQQKALPPAFTSSPRTYPLCVQPFGGPTTPIFWTTASHQLSPPTTTSAPRDYFCILEHNCDEGRLQIDDSQSNNKSSSWSSLPVVGDKMDEIGKNEDAPLQCWGRAPSRHPKAANRGARPMNNVMRRIRKRLRTGK